MPIPVQTTATNQPLQTAADQNQPTAPAVPPATSPVTAKQPALLIVTPVTDQTPQSVSLPSQIQPLSANVAPFAVKEPEHPDSEYVNIPLDVIPPQPTQPEAAPPQYPQAGRQTAPASAGPQVANMAPLNSVMPAQQTQNPPQPSAVPTPIPAPPVQAQTPPPAPVAAPAPPVPRPIATPMPAPMPAPPRPTPAVPFPSATRPPVASKSQPHSGHKVVKIYSHNTQAVWHARRSTKLSYYSALIIFGVLSLSLFVYWLSIGSPTSMEELQLPAMLSN